MREPDKEAQAHLVLGQKYAYATASLVLGLACFINIIGLEKAVLAIIFAWLALKSAPAPALTERRLWAKAGLALGLVVLLVIPAVLFFYVGFDGLRAFAEALEKLTKGK